ncbi:hypothetical protein HZZ00_02555 [Streptomyces sp. NEAU-sy36]|uniref:hypothetical protein n=1 Tax=unclassified Streptomyces TaxID=2593676 RepID=UPI0015D635C6|nr:MULTISPECIES: hypothetical protein [unclassified Streptomyces]QLI99966.1 hypothetical protein HZZ00_02555 [Streptomyces sp. NEAU-sy36]
MAITRRFACLAVCVLAAIPGVVGCSSDHHDGAAASTPAQRTAPLATPSSGSPTPDPHSPTVRKAPEINSDGIVPLAGETAVKGKSVYPIPGGIKAGKTLAIAINCQGPGRLTVQVQPTDITFPLLCERDEVLPTMNEIHMSKNHPTGSLRFTSEPNVTWSFAVGWDPHPPKQE